MPQCPEMLHTIRVELVQSGPVCVHVDGRATNIQGLGRALMFLVFLRGAKAKRATMARSLWPGESDEVSANRLRVTLTRLRSMLGSSIEVDRVSIRLTEVDTWCDLWEEARKIREALDEIDPREQLKKLTCHGASLRSTTWREFQDLVPDNTLSEWDEICSKAIGRVAELAAQESDWHHVDLAWKWMRDRGDLLKSVSELFLDAHFARGTLEEGVKTVRRAGHKAESDRGSAYVQDLMLYAKQLQSRSTEHSDYSTSQAHALGSVLLSRIDQCANGLAGILNIPEIQLSLQSAPGLYISILEKTVQHLEVGDASWMNIQSARIGAHASIYDYEHVIKICNSIFPYDKTPAQETVTWMHYSFSLFQLRRWEEAFSTIARAQQSAKLAEDQNRFDICKLTEGSYLWHVGRFELARDIYDDYIARHSDSNDFIVGVNRATCYANYAIIELVFGELDKAIQYAELAYSERHNFDLTRHLPLLLSLLSVIKARNGDLDIAIEYAVESLKLTYQRGSSREGQINMEWICGVMVVAGQREEAWQVLNWVNDWRKRTSHERSVCEDRFAEGLKLQDFEGTTLIFSKATPLRDVMRFQMRCLRNVPRPVEE